jgi:hypothetical protein
VQQSSVISASVQQWDTTIDELSGRLKRRFRDRQLDDCPDSTVCGFLVGTSIPGMTNPKLIRLDPVHNDPFRSLKNTE